MLKKLEDLPNFSLYVNESMKKNNLYKFWARPSISWDLKCDDKHPRNTVVSAANIEKDKEPLNEGAVMTLSIVAISAGTVAAFVVLTLFCVGKCKKSACGESGTKTLTGCCLFIQLILFTIVFFIVLG